MATILRLPFNLKRMKSFKMVRLNHLLLLLVQASINEMSIQRIVDGGLRDYESFNEMFGLQSDIYQEQLRIKCSQNSLNQDDANL
ncbi:unnamed protein product [Paramecium octaurelia]|uniref:Uncharacterized protein n=1 Tax=Paramecium octaurelia TaxID=43137 RepID=A0A8S1W6V6_PAROT|nr:unnamed protein product [Paramecium octaurelia]